MQPGPAVAQVLEPQGLQRHVLRHPLPGEGLHDGVLADPVEAPAEREVLTVPAGDVAPAAAVADVPDVDLGVHPVRPDPAGEQVGLQVGPHQLGRGGVEVAGDPDDGQPLVGADGGLGGRGRGGHDAVPFVGGVVVVGGAWGPRVGELGQHRVEALVALFCPSAIALDPGGHQVEHLRFQVDGSGLCLAALGHQAGVLEHLQVLGDRLHADLVRLGQLVDRGVGDRQPRHQVTPGRIRQGGEDPGELIGHETLPQLFG